jgi:hypothetical protein
MKKYYLTFGQIHVHSVNGKTFDKDCICVIDAENETEARKIAFDTFGDKWGTIYNKISTDLFPRGYINLKN